MEIINIVLPVFGVIATGYFLGAIGFVDTQTNGFLARLVFYVAAPALLFRSVSITPLEEAIQAQALLLIAVITVLLAFVVYFATARVAPSRRGVLAQGTHRSNMVFVGLPVIVNAFGESVLGPAAVLIGFMVVVYNLLAVLLLVFPHQEGNFRENRVWAKTFWEILQNPLILACGAGILFSAVELKLPLSIDRCLELIGRIAMPLALLSVGAGLDFGKLRVEMGASLLVSFIKLLVYPGLVYLGLLGLGFARVDLQFPVLLMAAPTAVVSYIMVKEMKGDEQLAAAIIIATTIGSMFTISLWLVFFEFMG